MIGDRVAWDEHYRSLHRRSGAMDGRTGEGVVSSYMLDGEGQPAAVIRTPEGKYRTVRLDLLEHRP